MRILVGVCVLAGSLVPELHPSRFAIEPELASVAEWLLDHRVNINVRQVWEGRPGVDVDAPDEQPNRKRSKLAAEAQLSDGDEQQARMP